MSKISPPILLGGLCAVGLLSGFAAKRLTASGPVSGKAESASHNEARRPVSAGTAADEPGRPGSKPKLASFPPRHSTDTPETLATLPDDELYTRLALWLNDASESDIAAYWSTYSKKKGASNDITDLIFLNWARLDPQAAINGSNSDHHAWWAWASHDPKGALAYATANAPDHINHVAWGIGEFHPEWTREHFKELPKGAQDNALRGMAKWEDGADPLASMKFLKEVGRTIPPGTFKALVRQDPWAAMDWMKENPEGRSSFGYQIDDPMKMIVGIMAEQRPEDLERLAAQTPSGKDRLAMESALFTSLLKTDPAAAMEQAKATTAPRVAAERYAAIGLGLVKTDPEQAFEIASSLFKASPEALNAMAMIEYPNGASGSGITIPGVSDFIGQLVRQDPQRILEMTIGQKTGRFGNSPFSTVADQWADRDFVGYAEWVNRQSDPTVRQQGASIVVNNLQQQGNYAEAIDWILSMKDDGGSNYRLSDAITNWNRVNPVEATRWLDEADLPEGRKTEIRKTISRNQ